MFNVLSIFRNVKSDEAINELKGAKGLLSEVKYGFKDGKNALNIANTQKSHNGFKMGIRAFVLSSLLGGTLFSGLHAHSYYDPSTIDLDEERRKDRLLFEEIDKQERAFKLDLREAASPDFEDAKKTTKVVRPGEEYEEHGYIHSNLKPAEYYMRNSIEAMFDDTGDFVCEGNVRSAECRVGRYEMQKEGIVLKNFRYTLDYKKERTIERISSNLQFVGGDDRPLSDDVSQFLPTSFECADFTQFYGNKDQINEQLVCAFKAPYYDISFRIRAKSNSPLFKDQYAIRFLQESSFFLQKLFNRVSDYEYDDNKDELLSRLNDMSKKTLSKIDTNIYSLELSVKKPLLPQKVYEMLFNVPDDISEDTRDMLAQSGLDTLDMRDKRERQVTKTLYNSGVGYIYGAAMGYVIGNDELKPQTKEGLTKALAAFRDSAMLGSNVSRVTLKFTNRTKEGVNLADAFKAVSERVSKANNVKEYKKEHFGRAINSFDADILNRYRIEVGVFRLKPNAPGYDKHGF